MKLLLNQIRTSDGTQSRTEIKEDVAEQYSNLIQEGEAFPPVTVFHNGENYWLADGFHRYIAHQRCGLTEIECSVFEGGLRDAIKFSLSANAKHGLNRTNADKRKAIATILDDIEWSELSVREVAKMASVSHMLVSNVINERKLGSMNKKPSVVHEKKPKENPIDSYASKEIHKEEEKPVITEFQDEDAVIELSTQLAEAHEENARLKELYSLKNSDMDESLKIDVEKRLEEYRSEIKRLEMENNSLRIARDSCMQENAELKKQIIQYKAVLKKKT